MPQTIESCIGFGRIPDNILHAPIEFLLADHRHQRALCAALRTIVVEWHSPETQSRANAVLGYLQKDFPRHVADEELSLFPLLSRRARCEDAIEKRLRLLSEEHRRNRRMARRIIGLLRQIGDGRLTERPQGFSGTALAFSEALRRHISWENTLILQLAGRQLTADDMLVLGRKMAERRGVQHSELLSPPQGAGKVQMKRQHSASDSSW